MTVTTTAMIKKNALSREIGGANLVSRLDLLRVAIKAIFASIILQ